MLGGVRGAPCAYGSLPSTRLASVIPAKGVQTENLVLH